MTPAELRGLCATALTVPNVRAFLRVIRSGETGQTPDAYTTMVGGQQFSSLQDHPRTSVYIPRLKVNSTAAGAYQFLARTWDECAKALELPDFSLHSQDLAAVYLIRRRGALDDVRAGRLEEAISKCKMEWASLPGDAYGQGSISMQRAYYVFRDYGGTPATAEPAVPASPPSFVPPPARDPYREGNDAQEQEKPVTTTSTTADTIRTVATTAISLLNPVAGALVGAFAPLAQEKLQRVLFKHTDRPEIAAQVSTAVIEAAKSLTKQDDPIDAVAAARRSPEIIDRIQQSVLDEIDKLVPLLERVAAIDRQSFLDEEASRQAAHARAVASGNDQDSFLTKAIVGILVGVIVGCLALVGVLAWLKVGETLIMAVFGILNGACLLAVAKFGTRYDHRYGSSAGSANKDAVRDTALAQIASRSAQR